MSESVERQAGAICPPEAFREFEALFLPWLNQNQEEVESGGSGDLKELASLCAAWALANRLTPKAD
jgi:hypothetical protein